MYFQATVAALVCLTAACVGLTQYYFLTLLLQIYIESRNFEADIEAASWIGKRRDVFYLRTLCSVIDLYGFFKFEILKIFRTLPTVINKSTKKLSLHAPSSFQQHLFLKLV